jgi:Na+-driven multidrug efflux pump
MFSIAINIVLDPCLIFGWWIFPKMGIAGAALATIISELIGITLRLYFLRKRNYIPRLKEFLKPSFVHTKRILTIGLPSAASNVTWSLIFPFLTVIITKFGMKPLAAINVAHRYEGFPYFFGLGLSIAMSAMIGKAYGANQKNEIRRIFTHGMILTTFIMAPMAAAFIFIPENLIALLNSDPGIIKEGAEYLRIIGYFEIFLGWELAIEGAFNGLGNTKPYMYIRIPLTILRVPLAYILAFPLNMGVSGVWWACTISTFLKGIIMFISFYSNKKNRLLLSTQ